MVPHEGHPVGDLSCLHKLPYGALGERTFALSAGLSEGPVDEVLDVVFVDGDEEHDDGAGEHADPLQEHLAGHTAGIAASVHGELG